MKKSNKKGFTLVELVIVIAVIAILAAVLIPTFATVIEKGKVSSRLQTAQNSLKMALAEEDDASIPAGSYIKVVTTDGTFWFKYDGSALAKEDKTSNPSDLPTSYYTYSKEDSTDAGSTTTDPFNYKVADMATGVTVFVKHTSNKK